MKLSVVTFIIFFFLTQSSVAQINAVSFMQLDSLQKVEKRPVVVFLHTSWCKYCGVMKNTTLKNKDVVDIMNNRFYFVSLDIEEKNKINFRGYQFKYKPTGTNTGVHELAEQLGTINGKIAYPGMCFLDADYQIIYQREGYIPAKELISILQKIHKT